MRKQLLLCLALGASACRERGPSIVAEDAAARVADTAPAPATLVVVCTDFAVGGVVVFAAGEEPRQVTERQMCDRLRVATFVLAAGAYRVRFFDMDTFRPGGTLTADDPVQLTEGRELRWKLRFTQRGEPYPRPLSTILGY